MSLQKIGKYTEIFESSRQLQRPTTWDSRRVAVIQNIAIAGLIESGAPYECENGEIIIDTGIDYKSVFINDVFPYLSPEGQTGIILKNSQKAAELPPPSHYQPQQPAYTQPAYQQQPQQASFTPYNDPPQSSYENEYQPYQNISVQPAPGTAPVTPPQPQQLNENYQTQASKEAEKKADPIKAMMDGLEDYSAEQKTPVSAPDVPDDDEMEKLFNDNLRQKQAENRKWQDASEIPPVQTKSVAEELKYTAPQSPQPSQPSQPAPQVQTLSQDEAVKKAEESTTVLMAEQPSQPKEDVVEMPKNDVTYERCNIEVKNVNTGKVYRFSVHSAPIDGLDDDNIIVRIKLLGKNSNYIQTNHGKYVDFAIENAMITASREPRPDGSFACHFSVNSGYEINKLNVETGGNKGNLVIYDDNLELRIYPLPNIKDQSTGKMVFGNNKNDEAAYLYYIKNNGQIIASSGVERKPTFKYNNCNLIIKAKWFGNDIRLTADEFTRE